LVKDQLAAAHRVVGALVAADVSLDHLDFTGEVSEVVAASRREVVEHTDAVPVAQQAVGEV
jgi:hypothetical protein